MSETKLIPFLTQPVSLLVFRVAEESDPWFLSSPSLLQPTAKSCKFSLRKFPSWPPQPSSRPSFPDKCNCFLIDFYTNCLFLSLCLNYISHFTSCSKIFNGFPLPIKYISYFLSNYSKFVLDPCLYNLFSLFSYTSVIQSSQIAPNKTFSPTYVMLLEKFSLPRMLSFLSYT